MTSARILNVSAYKFVALTDLPLRRQHLLALCSDLHLKGTVLLAEEGINLFLAGSAEAVHLALAELRRDPALHDLQARQTWSERPPFRRLRVRLKPEIIRMNHPAIQPGAGRAAGVDALTLARWLGQGHDGTGRPVVTLDTRNAFEVAQGRFRDAIDWRLTRFSEFPDAARAHRDQLLGKTVVSYCTGGIRCEKAALLLRELGIEPVYQLDGGILKYFEALPGAPHWQGRCFVFDERIALDVRLEAALS